MLRIALVTNAAPSERMTVFAHLARADGIDLHLLACPGRAPGRHRDTPPADTAAVAAPAHAACRTQVVHHNREVWTTLLAWQPDVVVTDGFDAPHLYAYLYARRHHCAHVVMTGSTLDAEPARPALHRWLRRRVHAGSAAFVAACDGGHALLAHYGVAAAHRFTSCPAVDNAAFGAAAPTYPAFDLLLGGRLEPAANPLFVLAVACEVAKRIGRCVQVLVVGTGPLEPALRARAALFPGLIRVHFHGGARAQERPGLYRSARLLLLPSHRDPWGEGVNEACASGMPVLISPHAGAAHELVRDGENGYVLPLELERWSERAAALLTDPQQWKACAGRAASRVAPYTFERAARGIEAACRHAALRQGSENAFARRFRSRPRVLIVERQLLHYRVEFYRRLRDYLEQLGIELQLLVGEGTPAEKMKRNEASLPWAITIPTHYFLQYRVCWQPFGRYARQADLVVVMHENKILYNLWLMFVTRPRRLAFWGHGANLQADRPAGVKERFKRWTVRRADWWFAYTDLSARLVAAAGFPAARTTTVDNAIDTDELRRLCYAIDPAALDAERARLGARAGAVGLYLGSLYKDKRLDFLLEAALLIKRSHPDFVLLVAGAGPEEAALREKIAAHPWIHLLGPVQGEPKARALMLADVLLNPGLVGLGILDSFASGRPMFTTDCGLHSPEIAYLVPDVNGIMTVDSVEAYAASVLRALTQPALRRNLGARAGDSAGSYSVDNMVRRLGDGVLAALST